MWSSDSIVPVALVKVVDALGVAMLQVVDVSALQSSVVFRWGFAPTSTFRTV